jgi:hypothetical protein
LKSPRVNASIASAATEPQGSDDDL